MNNTFDSFSRERKGEYLLDAREAALKRREEEEKENEKLRSENCKTVSFCHNEDIFKGIMWTGDNLYEVNKFLELDKSGQILGATVNLKTLSLEIETIDESIFFKCNDFIIFEKGSFYRKSSYMLKQDFSRIREDIQNI